MTAAVPETVRNAEDATESCVLSGHSGHNPIFQFLSYEVRYGIVSYDAAIPAYP